MRTRKTRRTIAAAAVLGLLLGLAAGAEPARAEPSGPPSAMQQYVEAMQPGWNLGNTFEASGSETAWGNPVVTKELIDAIAAEGYRSIRIPITWNHRMAGPPDYAIDETFMNRIKEVVGWALDADLYVMINLHHDSAWIMNMESQREETLAKFDAAWTQIAAAFKDYPDRLMFESINEPRFSEDWNKDEPVYFEMLDELNTAFHAVVRGSGGGNGTRPLVLPTVTASPSQARLDELSETIAKLDDPNLIATIHYYGFWPFSVNVGGSTTFDDAARGDLEAAFDRAYDTFVSRGIPVIVGEFGLLGFDRSIETVRYGEILKYLEHISQYAIQKRMTLMLWDNGQHFDRHALQWINPAFHATIQAGMTGRSSTAASDAVYVKAGKTDRDVPVKLNLNGNALAEVRHAGRVLAAGADYSVEGDTLTLKAGLLQPLLAGDPGVKAKFELAFSAGADWTLDLVLYDTPELRSTEGTRGLFGIPVRWNGDSLAALEAVYASGGNAGPDDWTPFKQYGKAFEPDYDAGLVMLTSDFFGSVNDGEVLLTLHYWSGEKQEYRLLIEGDRVTGTSPTAAAAEEPAERAPEGSAAEPAAAVAAETEPAASEANEAEPDAGRQAKPYAAAAVLAVTAVMLAAALYRNRQKREAD